MPIKKLVRQSGHYINRVILCVFSFSESTPETKQRSISREILLAIQGAQQSVDRSLEDLAIISPKRIRKVNLKPLTANENHDSISDYLADQLMHRNMIRLCIFVEAKSNEPSTEADDGNFPFFFTAFVDGGRQVSSSGLGRGWNYAEGPAKSIVVTERNTLCALVHDIALDIAMFDAYSADIIQELEKSSGRSEFVYSKSTNTRFGPINGEPCVVPIASICWRSPSNFDFETYVQFIEEYCEQVRTSIEKGVEKPSSRSQPAEMETSLAQILSIKKIAGQLSPALLNKAVEGLESGAHLLAVAQKKPNTPRQRQTVANTLHRSRWRRNTWRIFPFSEFQRLSRLYPFLTLYKFTNEPKG